MSGIKVTQIDGDLDKYLQEKAKNGAIVLERKTKKLVNVKPAEIVRELVKILLTLVINLKEEKPNLNHDDTIKEIINNNPQMKDFYKTHRTIFERVCDPKVQEKEIQEIFKIIHIRKQVEEGQISEQEGRLLTYQVAAQNHMHKMTDEQIKEYEETKKIPDGIIDDERAIRIAKNRISKKTLKNIYEKISNKKNNV